MMTNSRDDTMINMQCLICGESNSARAFSCHNCCAPMILVHDSAAQHRQPNIVSVIGDSNVGKTVYLGFLLDMLSQRAGDFEAVPKGPYSVDLQQNVISHMTDRQFPPKTPMEPDQWHWAYYQVRKCSRKSKWIDLLMPDMAGESLAAELAAPETFHVVRNLLDKSSGILLLVDAGLAANGSSRPDFFAIKTMSYLDSLYDAKRSRRIHTPIGIVLCKSDYCPECFDNPRRFVKANLTRLWNLCQGRFENIEFFACSTVGSLAYATSGTPGDDYVMSIPLHTALQGVLEPFEWIINRI